MRRFKFRIVILFFSPRDKWSVNSAMDAKFAILLCNLNFLVAKCSPAKNVIKKRVVYCSKEKL